ncbi:MAG: MBL fold metallo-hydrolase [Austwickia sp.]|nr:MBL fold metallo-hydrolase [Austwickia sp.]
MRMIAVGCSGSYPGPASSASCYLVQAEAGGRTWTIALDLGNGAIGPMHRFLDPRALDAVVLTHLHPDHCLDACGLYVMRTYQPQGPMAGQVPVWGPAGTAQRLGRAYGVAQPEELDDQFAFGAIAPEQPWEIGPFRITPYAMNHPVEAYGLRVEADGAALAYTGDTDDCPNLRRLFAGASLALVDCAFVDGRDEPRGIHMTGSRAATAGVEAGGLQRLMLTHIPSWNDPAVCRDQAASVWGDGVEVCEPLATYEL